MVGRRSRLDWRCRARSARHAGSRRRMGIARWTYERRVLDRPGTRRAARWRGLADFRRHVAYTDTTLSSVAAQSALLRERPAVRPRSVPLGAGRRVVRDGARVFARA